MNKLEKMAFDQLKKHIFEAKDLLNSEYYSNNQMPSERINKVKAHVTEADKIASAMEENDKKLN